MNKLKKLSETLAEIAETEFDYDFIEKMRNRVLMSHFKYGKIKKSVQDGYMPVETAVEHIKKYQETGNTECLIDAANNLMFEFMYPQHDDAHFRSQSADESVKRKFKEAKDGKIL